jgi:hypothetical protein
VRSFIVRPFGVKSGIDFDRVESELIAPALAAAGFSGGTTAEFIAQGNIRTDMFEQLLIADLVIADISIHNANAFYELGIRHAFRDKRTFLIRSRGDEVPFDLKTDRYMPYDAAKPEDSLEDLVAALKASWDSQAQDSPVFQLLPGLEATDPSKFLITPLDFSEELEQTQSAKNLGDLQLLAAEVDGFPWMTMGLRPIGKAQRALKNWKGARVTWEAIRKYDDTDLEANTHLGTIYQREGELLKSDQALQRALQSRFCGTQERAEIYALMGRNSKTLWEGDWAAIDQGIERQRAALLSPHLLSAFELYNKGFIEDRNHVYSASNALAMLTIMLELIAALPEDWEDGFESETEAEFSLQNYQKTRSTIASGAKLALESREAELERNKETDIWAEIGNADMIFLNSSKPSRVGRAYRKALALAEDFEREAAQQQLLLFQRLDIRTDYVNAALENIADVPLSESCSEALPKILLFSGHRIDAKGRETARFPAKSEEQARAMIKQAVTAEKAKARGELLGISGGASGGDILFHEVCKELDVPTRMYLALSKSEYIKSSVADAGPGWVERFRALVDELPLQVLSESPELPRWLRAKKNYNIWQRSSLWKFYNAMALSDDNVTLIALWDGLQGDGAGGTGDMVMRAKERGATFFHLDANELVNND